MFTAKHVWHILEFLDSFGPVVFGGFVAAASGLAVQWIHTTRERRNDIKKIRDLLKPDF